MKILLTNDDGYTAPGIAALAQESARRGHECWVVAPKRCYSGASHSMTFRKPFYVQKAARPLPKTFVLDATPADCVKFGLVALGEPFDLVLSGINNEPNLGTDAVYSGTVHAALEGAMNGTRSIAISALAQDEGDYVRLAGIFWDKFPALEGRLRPEVALSINLQNDPAAPWRAAHLGLSKFTDYYHVGEREANGVPYTLLGDFVVDPANGRVSDVMLFKSAGCHTITPLKFDFTAYESLAGWEEV